MNDILQPDDPNDLVLIEIYKKKKGCISAVLLYLSNTTWLSKQFYIIALVDIYN